MSNYRYEVDDRNTLRIWDSTISEEDPIIEQPFYPDGEEWTQEQAIEWANEWISQVSGNNPEE